MTSMKNTWHVFLDKSSISKVLYWNEPRSNTISQANFSILILPNHLQLRSDYNNDQLRLRSISCCEGHNIVKQLGLPGWKTSFAGCQFLNKPFIVVYNDFYCNLRRNAWSILRRVVMIRQRSPHRSTLLAKSHKSYYNISLIAERATGSIWPQLFVSFLWYSCSNPLTLNPENISRISPCTWEEAPFSQTFEANICLLMIPPHVTLISQTDNIFYL